MAMNTRNLYPAVPVEHYVSIGRSKSRTTPSLTVRARWLLRDAALELIGWLLGLIVSFGLWANAKVRGDDVTAEGLAWALLAIAIGGILFLLYLVRVNHR